MFIDPNLHKIIDHAENSDDKPFLNVNTGEIKFQNKVIANIGINYLHDRMEFIEKCNKFYIINNILDKE